MKFIAKIVSLLLTSLWLTACSPVFNWRDVPLEGVPVTALMPCKSDKGSRSVPLAGAPRQMLMVGCEAGGAMFTVAAVDVGSAAAVDAAQKEWQSVSKATHTHYATHGSVLVQAAVYSQPQGASDGPGALSVQAVETFFSGLRVASGR
jgi:hypothetical protein